MEAEGVESDELFYLEGVLERRTINSRSKIIEDFVLLAFLLF